MTRMCWYAGLSWVTLCARGGTAALHRILHKAGRWW